MNQSETENRYYSNLCCLKYDFIVEKEEMFSSNQ